MPLDAGEPNDQRGHEHHDLVLPIGIAAADLGIVDLEEVEAAKDERRRCENLREVAEELEQPAVVLVWNEQLAEGDPAGEDSENEWTEGTHQKNHAPIETPKNVAPIAPTAMRTMSPSLSRSVALSIAKRRGSRDRYAPMA